MVLITDNKLLKTKLVNKNTVLKVTNHLRQLFAVNVTQLTDYIYNPSRSRVMVGIHINTHELLAITNWVRVPYCKSGQDFLGLLVVAKTPPS
jgi:hypothetical protein